MHRMHVPWYVWLGVAGLVALSLVPLNPGMAEDPLWLKLLIGLMPIASAVPGIIWLVNLGVQVRDRGIEAGRFAFQSPIAFPHGLIDPASVRHWTDVGRIPRGLGVVHHRWSLTGRAPDPGITFVAPNLRKRAQYFQEYELWTISLRDPAELLHSWAAALDAAGAPGGDMLRHQAAHPGTVGPDPAGLARVPVPAYLQRRAEVAPR